MSKETLNRESVGRGGGADEWVKAMSDVKFQGERRMSRRRISEALQRINGEAERSGEIPVRPKTEIVCDRDHIEGQRIEVINKSDKGEIEFSFKLRMPTETTEAMMTMLEVMDDDEEIKMSSGAVLKRGEILYEGISGEAKHALCDAAVLEREGVRILVADPNSRANSVIYSTGTRDGQVRTALGLIKVEVPAGMSPEEMEVEIGEILESDLGIPDAFGEVSKDAERNYKMARYAWMQHMAVGEMSPEQIQEAEKLERKEVFPGYTTLVEEGKYKEYLARYGEDVRAVHELHTGNTDSIYRILTQGVMSTSERYARGVMRNGMSSRMDVDTGGADNVFTRVMPKWQREKDSAAALVVMKPEIFDRTDWYAYKNDMYGSTEETVFAERLSPDEAFTWATEFYSPSNEQMFRTGIGAEYIEEIAVYPAARRERIVRELREKGLEEVGGRPIEEIIVGREKKSARMDEWATDLFGKFGLPGWSESEAGFESGAEAGSEIELEDEFGVGLGSGDGEVEDA